jgi:hypothetical protein
MCIQGNIKRGTNHMNMTPQDFQNSQSNKLRRLAVERLADRVRAAVVRCGNDTRRMLQEMEHYNIELEMQIEELRQKGENVQTSKSTRT